MRNPARKAFYCFLLVAASVGLIWWGIEPGQDLGDDWTEFAPVLLGLGLLPFPSYILVEALFAIRGRARLVAGIGVIARWQAAPAEWERFRGLDSRRSAQGPSRVNALWIRSRAPAEPVEVIVGERSALVDGSYHPLNPRGLPELVGVDWIEGPPACLQFELRYPRGRYGGRVTTTLRIPVPAGARGEAAKAFAHFQSLIRPRPGSAQRSLERAYSICAFLLVAAITFGGIGYASAPDVPGDSLRLTFLGLLIGASVLALIAALFVVAAILLAPRR